MMETNRSLDGNPVSEKPVGGHRNLPQMPSLVLQVSPGGLEHGGGIGRMIGYMIDAWDGHPGRPKIQVLDTRGSGHIIFAPWYFLRALCGIALQAKHRPLLHVHVAGRGSTIRKIILVHYGRALKLPIVLHLHDYNYRDSLGRFPKLIQRAARSMFEKADMVVVLGADDRNLVENDIGVCANRIAVVSNAVPKPQCKFNPPSPIGTAHIVFVGNPSRRKGLHDLIAALAEESLVNLNWRLSVAGGGPEVEDFRAMVRGVGLSARVDFLGWVGRAEISDLLQSADLLVLPSYAEGMAMSVLEGMSYRLCIVCTNVGSLKEVIVDGLNGLVVEPGRVDQLANALRRGISDPGLRQKLGSQAARLFSEKFDAANYPERIERVYQAAYTQQASFQGRTGK
jgi:glycosyltransferase involved in cell wall biosynthesis